MMNLFPDDNESGRMISTILQNEYTLVGLARMQNLKNQCVKYSAEQSAFVECGVAKGGCLALMAFLSNGNKQVWGFDSFEGMPKLTKEDGGQEDAEGWVGFQCGSEAAVVDTFSVLGISRERVSIVKGWFEDTLPGARTKIGSIAILRLDNDWYKSTRFCLETLYENVIEGGVIIIDDYGAFTGCQRAVDEFRARHGIQAPLHHTDRCESFWYRMKGDYHPVSLVRRVCDLPRQIVEIAWDGVREGRRRWRQKLRPSSL